MAKKRPGSKSASKASSKSKNNKSGKNKKPFYTKKNQKREVVFDPEARKAYLRGFSERKRQRRAYGLAMQKVKDRKEKIEQRSENKKDVEERVREAEQQKETAMELMMEHEEKMSKKNSKKNSNDDSDNESNSSYGEGSSSDDDEKKTKILNEITYDDKKTAKQWGGRVTVVTSEVALDEDEESDDDGDNDSMDFDDDDGDSKHVKKSVDAAQKYAGNVEKFMSQLKGNMPSKKKRKDMHSNTKRKGKHGAADTVGMGGAANLKTAQKMLSRVQAKGGGGKVGKTTKGKGKKRGRR